MNLTEYEIKDAFLRAMHDAGIRPVFGRGQGIEFGLDTTGGGARPWRFHVEGDPKGTRNGWYVLFGDGIPAGEFGSWKTGVTQTWCARNQQQMSAEERAAIEARMEESRRQREAAQRAAEGAAAKAANMLWNSADPVRGDDHPYLQRKGVRSHGLRVCDWPVRAQGDVVRTIPNTLLIPIMDARGRITSLQAIFPHADERMGRDKDFLPNGRKRGCFYTIGEPRADRPLYFAEGYATAETVHRATGCAVVVCWDAYNLPHVVASWREAMPGQMFVIAADNDQFTKTPVDNPGVTYARRAAHDHGARVFYPEFADLDGKPTDFNDLEQREGMDAVMRILMPPPPRQEIAPVSNDARALQLAGYAEPDSLVEFDKEAPFPDFDMRLRPLPTARNLTELARRVGAVLRYNVIKKRAEVIIPGHIVLPDVAQETALNMLKDAALRARIPTAGFMENVGTVAGGNPYNPVATWIGSRPWDGKSRLADFCATVEEEEGGEVLADGRKLKDVLMVKWLVSAVAAAYEDNGVSARGVLTFVSKQNLGKTYWAKQLAPRELDAIKDGTILRLDDKDSIFQAVSHWIVELGEIDGTFNRSDMGALKAFITKGSDELRRPYARGESYYPRRTVFFASVNEDTYLRDKTGNSRFWSIKARALGRPSDLDMQQVWAEVKALYDAGHSWFLTREEEDALTRSNTNFQSILPTHEMIDRAFDWDAPQSLWTNQMRATEIAMAAGIERPTQIQVNDAAAYVQQRYGVTVKRAGKARNKVWLMPGMLRSGRPEGPL